MTFEGMSQLLDGLSFLLVTPEFLGEEKLKVFRRIATYPFDPITEDNPEEGEQMKAHPFKLLLQLTLNGAVGIAFGGVIEFKIIGWSRDSGWAESHTLFFDLGMAAVGLLDLLGLIGSLYGL